MVLLPAGQLQLNAIVNYLCSGQDSWGWMSRPSAVDNANTAAVDTIAQPIPQTFTLHAPGSSILTAPTGPIIVAGFQPPNSVLNGTYGQGQYSVNVATAIITIRKVVSELSVTGYSGQGGTVRPADYAFTAYQPVTTADWDLVPTRPLAPLSGVHVGAANSQVVPFHPCGMVMDILRRGYKTWMVEWNSDATQFPIRWFRSDPKAQVFPGLSAFCSSNWDPWWVGNELGEQWPRNRSYDKGANPLGYAGLNYCGPEYAFQIGGFHGITPPITTLANGYSPCCLTINMGIQIPSGFGIKPWQWKGRKFRSGFGLISDQGLTVVQHYAGRLAWSASSSSTTAWASTYAGLLAWSASSSSTTAWASTYAGLLAWLASSSSTTAWASTYAGLLAWLASSSSTTAWASTYAGLLAWLASSSSTTAWASTYAGLLAWSASSSSTTAWAKSYAGALKWSATSTVAAVLGQHYAGLMSWSETSQGTAVLVPNDVIYMQSVFGDESVVLTGNAVTYALAPSSPYNTYWYQNPAQVSDSLKWTVYWPSGTYTLNMMYQSGPGTGDVEILVDGVALTTVDTYDATVTYGVIATVSVTLATAGAHTIQTIVTGKNPSSVGYGFHPTKFWIQ